MIKSKKIFGIFNTIEVISNNEDEIDQAVENNDFSRAYIFTNKEISLPSKFILRKVKMTPIVSLDDKKIEEVFLGFKKNTRNEISKTFNLPDLHISRNLHKDEAYQVYANFEYKQHRIPVGRAQFEGMHIFEASWEKGLVSVISCVDAFPRLKVFSISSERLDTSDPEKYKIIGYATKRLIYEICKYGTENGYRELDLAYVNLKDPSKAGIDSFKMQFNGEITNEFLYIYKSFLLEILEKLIFIKLFYKKQLWKK
jgi:hypothetical protein